MGTIIADSSHFTAFHRNRYSARLLLFWPAFLPRISPFSYCPENAALILPPGMLQPGFRMVRCPSFRIASPEVLADGAPSWSSCGSHCCFPPMIKQFPAFTFFCLQKVFSSRSYLIIFPPLGSTFQRTLYSGWRLSVSVGFTLRVPAPTLPTGRLSPDRSDLLPN